MPCRAKIGATWAIPSFRVSRTSQSVNLNKKPLNVNQWLWILRDYFFPLRGLARRDVFLVHSLGRFISGTLVQILRIQYFVGYANFPPCLGPQSCLLFTVCLLSHKPLSHGEWHTPNNWLKLMFLLPCHLWPPVYHLIWQNVCCICSLFPDIS